MERRLFSVPVSAYANISIPWDLEVTTGKLSQPTMKDELTLVVFTGDDDQPDTLLVHDQP